MKNEAEFKSQFKKSVKAHHGFAISLAAPMIAGTPDLYVVIPEFLPILLEAKWLGEITREKFSRKVPFTDMQQHWIKCCDNVSPYSAMGLIGCIYQGNVTAILVKYGTPQFYQLTNSFVVDCAYATLKKYTDARHFNILELFNKVPIPRMAKKVNPSIYTDTLLDNANYIGDSLGTNITKQ